MFKNKSETEFGELRAGHLHMLQLREQSRLRGPDLVYDWNINPKSQVNEDLLSFNLDWALLSE